MNLDQLQIYDRIKNISDIAGKKRANDKQNLKTLCNLI